MPHFAKPREGSWTEHFGIDTGPMSYEDSISPERFELERDAIFRRTWLNVGRVEQLRRPEGCYTQRIEVADTTVLIVRSDDERVAAFRNECRRCGHDIVWKVLDGKSSRGLCSRGSCDHRYDLDGRRVAFERDPLDSDRAECNLVPVRVDVWEGFVFVNLDSSSTAPLREYLGRFASGLEGYPFGEMTQVFKYSSDVGSNWKLYIDAFAEFYHAPVLHAKQYVSDESRKLMSYGFEALHYDVDGPHGMVSSWGGMAPPKDPRMVKPIERVLRSGNFGPWDRPRVAALDELPPGLNPSRHPAWGLDSYVFFPNFMIVVWEPGWYLTYHYWPTAYNRHTFEGTLYMVPPETATDRLRQELAAVTFKEFALQDSNTLEATQTMLETRVVSEFPLNDQEVLLRHLHATAEEYVARFRQHPDTGSAVRRSKEMQG